VKLQLRGLLEACSGYQYLLLERRDPSMSLLKAGPEYRALAWANYW
jgi:hypothetical protein